MRIVVHTPGFDDVDISVGSGRQTFKWLSLVVCQRLESKVRADLTPCSCLPFSWLVFHTLLGRCLRIREGNSCQIESMLFKAVRYGT